MFRVKVRGRVWARARAKVSDRFSFRSSVRVRINVRAKFRGSIRVKVSVRVRFSVR
jgi:hypothetical protein